MENIVQRLVNSTVQWLVNSTVQWLVNSTVQWLVNSTVQWLVNSTIGVVTGGLGGQCPPPNILLCTKELTVIKD